MARTRDRAIAWFFAIIFIISSVAVSAAVIYTMISSNNKSANTQEDTKVDPANQLKDKPLAGFTPLADIPELKVEDTKVGTGATAKLGDNVVVDYTGALASTGIVFESSKDSGQTVPFALVAAKAGQQGVIKGFADGIAGMKEGGTRRILIPSDLAYGEQGSPPTIPPNADLVFDITLYKTGQ